jgi:hypothetical protein
VQHLDYFKGLFRLIFIVTAGIAGLAADREKGLPVYFEDAFNLCHSK